MDIKKILVIIIIYLLPVVAVSQNLSDIIIRNRLKEYATEIPGKRISLLINLLISTKKKSNITDSTRAKISDQISLTFEENNQLDSATYYALISYKFWSTYKTNCPNEYANSAYNVAFYYHIRFNYLQAIEYYKIAIRYHSKNSYKAYCYSLIASLYGNLGDIEEAKLNLIQAKNSLIDPSQDYLTATELYNQLAINSFHKKEYLYALNYLETALKYYHLYTRKGEKDYNLLADIYNNFAYSNAKTKDYLKAKYYYNSAEKLYQTIGKKNDILSKIYSNQLAIYAENQDFIKADFFSNKSLALLNELNIPTQNRQKTIVYYNCGYLLLQKAYYNEAITYFLKSINSFPFLNFKEKNLFQNIRDKSNLLIILKDIARAYHYSYNKNKLVSNLNNSLIYYGYADHLLNLMRQEHQGQQSKSFWREHSRSLYESAIEACYLAKDTKKAFYFLEKSRAMLLLDDLKENNARQLLSAQEQTKEKNFQQKLLELQIQLENKQEKSTEYQQIIGEIASVKLAFSDFKKDLEKRFPEYYTAKYNEDFKDLPTLQKWLETSQHQAFISYFVGDSVTYAMKVTPADTKLIKLPKDSKNLSSQFINLCADINELNASFPSFLATSNQLYNALIKPLGLDGQRIIISYDDQFLPFEALSRSAKKADFMLEYHAISYAYSANFLLKSIENKNKHSSSVVGASFLGVAPVHFSQSLPIDNLLLSGQSIKNIEDIFSGQLMLGDKATKDAFIKQFPDYRLVQLYTHADTTKKGPVFYLQDAPMYVSEIRPSQPIKTELILLSACKTGLGKNVKGEGIFSLSRGFSALGVPSLITTLWSVDEKATYSLTELFHKNLKQGLPKDLALQKAKQEFIHQDTRNILPTLWASSILIGDTSPINDSNWWLVSILCISILSSSLFLYSRFRQKNKLNL